MGLTNFHLSTVNVSILMAVPYFGGGVNSHPLNIACVIKLKGNQETFQQIKSIS